MFELLKKLGIVMKSMVLRRLIEHPKNNKRCAQSIDLVSEIILEPELAFKFLLSVKLSLFKVGLRRLAL